MSAEPALEAIVRDLANNEPEDSGHFCTLCSAPTDEHRRSCPYRRAVEWVEANPYRRGGVIGTTTFRK